MTGRDDGIGRPAPEEGSIRNAPDDNALVPVTAMPTTLELPLEVPAPQEIGPIFPPEELERFERDLALRMGIPYEFIRTPQPGEPGYEEWGVLQAKVFAPPSPERQAELQALQEQIDELGRRLPLAGLYPEAPSIVRPDGERFSIRAWMPMLRRVYARLRERGEAEFCASHMGTIDEAMAALESSANGVVQMGLCRLPAPDAWGPGVGRIADLGRCDPAKLDALLQQPACDPGPAFTPQPLPPPEPLVLLTEDGGIALSHARTVMDEMRARLWKELRIDPEYLKGPVDPQAKANQERFDGIMAESLRAEVGAVEPCRCLEAPQVCARCGHRHHLHARTQPRWLQCVQCGTAFPSAGR